ncbi:MAG TPA: HD domain-containing phosphohydrolase, partial [Holophaga sp.]|nr:HD domain-containing phosphohydrolase [Holophaga sp.]
PEEQAVMRQHPLTGRTMVDAILASFGAEQLEHVDLLRHVAEGHHELLDGSGYPHGLREDEVPIAARIIAVADIFDALTSRRPYKTPWPNTEAFAYLRRQAEGKLDRDCVEALIAQKEAVERIQATFAA